MTEKESFIDFLIKLSEFIHENYSHEIMEAYKIFWEEEDPETVLNGVFLELGEMNFNDWLLFDYQNTYGESFINLYEKEANHLDDLYLKKAKESIISLYEVEDISPENLKLKDLLRDGTYEIARKTLSSSNLLKKGDIFATRLIHLDDGYEISPCVYPFMASHKEKLLEFIDKQFKRYLRNENPSGSITDFLKTHSQFFNVLWMDFISK